MKRHGTNLRDEFIKLNGIYLAIYLQDPKKTDILNYIVKNIINGYRIEDC